jgi:hypothetical protein
MKTNMKAGFKLKIQNTKGNSIKVSYHTINLKIQEQCISISDLKDLQQDLK